MAEIVPRWEWRAFGAEVEPAERRLGALASDRTEESVRRSAEVLGLLG